MKTARIASLMVSSLLITLYIFLNSYEVAFNKNIQYISAIDEVNLKPLESSYKIDPLIQGGPFDISKNGNLLDIKIGQKIKIGLAPAIYSDETWLARVSSGHYGSIFSGQYNQTQNLLIYGRQSSRTIPEEANIERGDVVSIKTSRNIRYIFRVESTVIIRGDSAYLMDENGKSKLVIFEENKATSDKTIITAEYVLAENI